MTDPAPGAVVVQRVLPAPPEVVFDQWIDPVALRDWMCPRPAHPTNVEVDPSLGGRLRLDIEELGTEFTVSGRFLELDRPRRLSFTWSCSNWADPSVETVVTVTFEPHGDGGTLMTIHHAALPADVLLSHDHGWTVIADQLALALVRRA